MPALKKAMMQKQKAETRVVQKKSIKKDKRWLVGLIQV